MEVVLSCLSRGTQCTKVSEIITGAVAPPKIPKIFISYSHKDREFLNQLTMDLEKAGMSVWVDEKKIKVGDPISQKVEEGITGCDYFCLVISGHSGKSKWVDREYRTALNRQLSSNTTLKILPLIIENIKLPPLLGDIRYANFSMDYNIGLNELLDAIK